MARRAKEAGEPDGSKDPKVRKWEPSPQQKKALTAAIEAGFDRNISKIAVDAGVPRRTLYKWFDKDPDFLDAWENIWRITLGRHIPGIVSAQIKRAQKGDSRAARLILDLVGAIRQVHKHVHTGPDNGPIPHEHEHRHYDLTKLSDQELTDFERIATKATPN